MRSYLVLVLLLTTVRAIAAPSMDLKIDARIRQLQKRLLSRESPSSMLLPSLDESTRQHLSNQAMRAYTSLDFEYKLSDLRKQGEDIVDLPLHVKWKTEHLNGSLSGRAEFVRVGDEWYFRSFDFLVFPWLEVIVAALLGLIFSLAMFALYRRLQKRKKTILAPA